MSYRFQRVFTGYREYIPQFYARRPGLAEQPYAEQRTTLLYDAVERSDSYSVTLRTLGCETDEIIADAGPMQQQWTREHNLSYNSARWMPEIVLAQIKAYRPEVLFLNSWLPTFDAAFVRECRATCPSIRMVIGCVGEAHPGAAHFAEHDLLLSCAPDTVAWMREQGINARHLNHAFDPRILDRLRALRAAPLDPVDLGFIGHIYLNSRYHDNRAQMFLTIAKQVKLTIFGELPHQAYARRGLTGWLRMRYYSVLRWLQYAGLARIAQHLPRYESWQKFHEQSAPTAAFDFMRPNERPAVYGLEMYRTLSNFKVCLNAHGPSAYASNLRLYEATGVGTCLLTDWKENLPELFEPDIEIAAYRHPEDAVEKALYLLDHDAERQAMASAGQRRTLRDHTTVQRTHQLHTFIQEFLKTHA
jgi:hypothetical protein